MIGVKAQYGTLDAILTRLEQRQGVNKNLVNVSIDDKKFVFIKDFEDHTERNFVIFKGNDATFVEINDDNKTGKSSSKVYSGDIMRSNKNIISVRCDLLEGKKIPVALTKTFFLTMQDNILYLIDVNTKERWIDESSFKKTLK